VHWQHLSLMALCFCVVIALGYKLINGIPKRALI
jgi:hypothetical protein